MKTRILLIILLAYYGCRVEGQSVAATEALMVARNFSAAMLQTPEVEPSPDALYSGETLLCYVFRLVPQGFIVVGAHRELPPVLCYSRTSSPPGEGTQNPLTELLKADIGSRLKYLECTNEQVLQKNITRWEILAKPQRGIKADSSIQYWPPDGSTCSGGWITTYWTQGTPYNNMCPIDPNTQVRSYAGCPAVAMGQIVNYHETLNLTRFSDADDYYHNFGTGNKYWIDDDYLAHGFPSFAQLNLYLDTLEWKYGSKMSLSDHDKAALTFACAVSAKQVFSSSGSGTYSVSQAYDAYQRFGFATARLLPDGDTTILSSSIQNIKTGLPVHLAVVDAAWSTGHNLVADGYNTDGYFHLNFGWGGSSDGWYYLMSGLPYQLDVIEGVVVDINKSCIGIAGNAPSTEPALQISPNPAGSEIQVNLPENGFGVARLDIFDMSGNCVFTETISGTAKSIQLDLKGYMPGMYLLRVTGKTSTATRFLKF